MTVDPGESSLGAVVFANRHDPPLPPGTFTVTTTQSITVPAAIDETYRHELTFAVRGERFNLNAGEARALFPPAGGVGNYDNVLPHIVFERRTLPWERSATLQGHLAAATSEAGGGIDPGTPGWLAVLIFHDEASPSRVGGAVSDLISTAASKTIYSYPHGYAALGRDFSTSLDYGETPTDPCYTIDVPADLFSAIAPSMTEMALLTHARAVTVPTASGGDSSTTDYAVVVANRLPLPNVPCTAHLVSLEGLGASLPGDDGTPATELAGFDTMRLVSLASWNFTSRDPAETLIGYLMNVNKQPAKQPANLQLPVPDGVTNQNTVDALNLGYTAMNHRTRLGDSLVSYYRGPLLPYRPAPGIVSHPDDAGYVTISTADQLQRYDPSTGMFDLTYAAAWQLGRLLGLGDRSFSTGLYAWRRAQSRATAAAIQRAGVTPATHRDDLLHGSAAWLSARLTSSLRGTGSTAATDWVNERRGSGPVAASDSLVTATGHDRAARADELRRAAADPILLRSLHADASVPDPVSSFLTRLGVLTTVPLSYLVPDAGMLPAESIRFFDVDDNWVLALLEGACSVGRSTSADEALDAALMPALVASAGRPRAATGFLLRSAAVAGWPNLQVTPYDPDDEPVATPPLRFEQVAPSLLLYLTEGPIARFDIHEASEGLHFGLDVVTEPGAPPHPTPSGPRPAQLSPVKVLRWLAPGGPTPVGKQDPSLTAPVSFRAPQTNLVLRVRDFATDAAQTLSTAAAGPAKGTLTSAELAVELVEGVDLVSFPRPKDAQ